MSLILTGIWQYEVIRRPLDLTHKFCDRGQFSASVIVFTILEHMISASGYLNYVAFFLLLDFV